MIAFLSFHVELLLSRRIAVCMLQYESCVASEDSLAWIIKLRCGPGAQIDFHMGLMDDARAGRAHLSIAVAWMQG